MRAPFQVLVLPYRRSANRYEYALLLRSDSEVWQGVAGGGEGGESPAEAARREAREEAGLPDCCPLLPLQTTNSIPVAYFKGRSAWPADLYVIPEYAYGIDAGQQPIKLSPEHRACVWLSYEQAEARTYYASNLTALWELNMRLLGADPRS
ncbi:MAG: NUDIX domain-containing protein [Anaerolineae bacterium]